MHLPSNMSSEPESVPECSYMRRYLERDREYIDAFRALSKIQRKAMAKRGITGPELNDPVSDQGACDVSDFYELSAPEASISDRQRLEIEFIERFHFPPRVATALIQWIEAQIEIEATLRRANLLARVAGALVLASNVKVSVMGLAFACEFGELNISKCSSMAEAGRRVGCSTAYISQQANFWIDLLELPRPKGMKTAEGRASYREHRKKNHWRNAKFESQATKQKKKKKQP